MLREKDRVMKSFPGTQSTSLLALRLLVISACAWSSVANGDEPYQRYLDVLKENRHFDQALVYIDMLSVDANVGRQFQQVADLERGMLMFQSAAVMPVSNPKRESKLNEAEKTLRKFISEKPSHPRRADARMKLGELLLARAEEARRLADEPDAGVPEAVKFYDDAYELFEGTVAELGKIIQGMRGARVDPNDKQKIAFRDRIQRSARQAQLLSAKSLEERGRSRKSGSSEQKADLNKALEAYNELYRKERQMGGIRNYALYYRSQIQRELGKQADAIDGLQRIADLQAVDALRPLQILAVTSLVEIFAKQEKYKLALERGASWTAQLRPDEENTVDAINLRLTVAKLKLDWADSLREADRSDRAAGKMVREVRSDIKKLLRIGGDHQEETKELLARAGVESSAEASDELPEVKNFGEALAEATDRLNASNTDTINSEALQDRLASASDAEKEAIASQLADVESRIDLQQKQAITLLNRALELFGNEESDDRQQLYEARFKLALLYLKQQRPWVAISIGEFLARENPSSERGLNAAALALGGLSDLLTTASSEQQAVLSNILEPLAIYLSETWPDSEEAAAATAATVQLALVGRDWAKAESLLAMLPKDAPAAAATRRDVGLAYYSDYLNLSRSSDKAEVAKAGGAAKKAATQLSAFWKSIDKDSIDGRAIDAANALVRLRMSDGKSKQAQSILLESPKAVLKLIGKDASIAPVKTALESYRLGIQLYGKLLIDNQVDATKASDSIQTYIAQMQRVAKDDSQGAATLASVFVGLARDLNTQLTETKVPAQRKKLFELLTIVSEKAAVSDAFNVRFWAADTLVLNAKEIESTPGGEQLAKSGYTAAATVLQSILEKEAEQPGWIDPAGLQIRVKLLLAECQRNTGDFRSAVKGLGAILKENKMLLDVQIEAAKTLAAWGKENPAYFKTAYEGGPGNSKLFWGWGKIAQQTMRSEKFSKQFFEARYGLARNRYLYGKRKNDAKIIAQAERDITQTSALYPELGGPKQKQLFDSLLKLIRKDLGK
ncbi:MAG: hypothetical protein Aurels2KO_22100 [Aureliella sp.]